MMNTIEILQEQRKTLEKQVDNLNEELGDIDAAISAIEDRQAGRPDTESARKGSDFGAGTAGEKRDGDGSVLMGPALRPRSAAAG